MNKGTMPWYSYLNMGLLLISMWCVAPYTLAGEKNDEGVPAVLQFALKYGAEKQAEAAQKPSDDKPATKKIVLQSNDLQRQLKQQSQALTHLMQENRQLREAAKKRSEEDVGTPDIKQQVTVLQGQLQTEQESYNQKQGALTAEIINLKQQLASIQIQKPDTNELKQHVASLEKEQSEMTAEIVTLKRQLVTQQEQLAVTAELKLRVANLEKEKSTLETQQADIKTQMAQMPVVKAEDLTSGQMQQNYAAGVIMGRDMQVQQEAQALLGVRTDNRIWLAGVRDAINHKVLLNPEVLQTALAEAEVQMQSARQKVVAGQAKMGADWLATFRKKVGVRQDKSGFWYRIDYAGNGETVSEEGTSVDVVVTEKLTDGTVVEDMDAKGRVLSMALGDFPPVFRTALMMLKNHGTMTLVVPPSLAYGDEGYPPKVPPGATMVYTLRIENIKPEKKTTVAPASTVTRIKENNKKL